MEKIDSVRSDEKIFIATWNPKSRLVQGLKRHYGEETIVLTTRELNSNFAHGKANRKKRSDFEFENEDSSRVPWNLVDAMLLVQCRHFVGHPMSSFSLAVYLWRGMDSDRSSYFPLPVFFGLTHLPMSALSVAMVLSFMLLILAVFRHHSRIILCGVLLVILSISILSISILAAVIPIFYRPELYFFTLMSLIIWKRRNISFLRSQTLFVTLICGLVFFGLCTIEIYSSIDYSPYSETDDFTKQTRYGVSFGDFRWDLNVVNEEIMLVGEKLIDLDVENAETTERENGNEEPENNDELEPEMTDTDDWESCRERCRRSVRCIACNYYVVSRACTLLSRVEGAVWYPDHRSEVLKM